MLQLPHRAQPKDVAFGDALALVNYPLSELEEAGLSIVNLECPLVRRRSRTEKAGPYSRPSATCVKGLKAAGVYE